MPEPPDVNLVSHYLLENPWPIGIGLLVIAACLGWLGMREGMVNRMLAALGIAVLAAAVLIVGALVVTPAEHAKSVTREMVDAAVAGDATKALSLVSQDAAFAVGSPKNPAFGYEFIESQLMRLTQRFAIESNSITTLKGYTESSELATTHMACYTTVQGIPRPNISRWVIRVQRQPDDQWKIIHITCVSVNEGTPPLGGLR